MVSSVLKSPGAGCKVSPPESYEAAPGRNRLVTVTGTVTAPLPLTLSFLYQILFITKLKSPGCRSVRHTVAISRRAGHGSKLNGRV